MLTFVCLVFSNAWPRYLLGSARRFRQGYLRPCVLRSITLAALIMSLASSCVVGPVPTALQRVMLQEGLSWWFLRYIKPSDQTWKFIQDILFCSLGLFFFFYNFVLVPFLHLQTDVKWRKGTATKKPVCSCLNIFREKTKVPPGSLNHQKIHPSNSAWLVDAKAKGLPFNG